MDSFVKLWHVPRYFIEWDFLIIVKLLKYLKVQLIGYDKFDDFGLSKYNSLSQLLEFILSTGIEAFHNCF